MLHNKILYKWQGSVCGRIISALLQLLGNIGDYRLIILCFSNFPVSLMKMDFLLPDNENWFLLPECKIKH